MKQGNHSLLNGFQKTLKGWGKALWRDESGVTAIEYALLASLIAMVALAGITTLGGEVGRLWKKVGDEVTGAM